MEQDESQGVKSGLKGGASSEKIDMFSHILPPRYNEALQKKSKPCYYLKANSLRPALGNLQGRLQFMDRNEGLRQVLSLGAPPPEYALAPNDCVDLVKLANDEMAELAAKYPEKFPAAIASVPMINLEAALREIDRAVSGLKFKGIQVFANVNGKPLDHPDFLPVYEKMAQYDLPIWIHPCRDLSVPDYAGDKTARYALFVAFAWPFETTMAMGRLVYSGIMEKFPTLKFIAHHCGAMVPFFSARIQPLEAAGDGEIMKLSKPPAEYFKRFYGDTVLGGNTSALMCGYNFFGADHMVFATDYPYPGEAAHDAVIKAIGRMNITNEEKAKIFSRNARRLLKLA